MTGNVAPVDLAEPPASARLRREWVTVGRWRLHTRRSTTREGAPAIVLVHGFAVSSSYLVPIAQQLAATHRVFAPDLPGFGASDRPERALDLRDLAETLAAWMDTIGLERATLLGNSFGCQIIVEFALRYPERVERAILIGPTIDPTARNTLAQLWRLGQDAVREPMALNVVQALDYLRFGPRRLLATFRVMMRDRIEAKLPDLTAPTLVVRGERDPIVPQSWAEQATLLLPDGRLAVIPGVAHAVNYTAPMPLARVVRRFLVEDRDEAVLTPLAGNDSDIGGRGEWITDRPTGLR